MKRTKIINISLIIFLVRDMLIPDNHPRVESLKTREKLIEGMHSSIVAEAGLIAHGRGEAFDYILGEESPTFSVHQQRAAIALLLTAERPVISVNGNVAALCAKEIVELSEIVGAVLEINLFYRKPEREQAIERVLKDAGAHEILGLDQTYHTFISELSHLRRIVDKRGIFSADVVMVPLEDGDRTMALRRMGKNVISIDLNPLSRTSMWSNITIVNNLIRALPEMIEIAIELKDTDKIELKKFVKEFNNYETLKETISYIAERLEKLSKRELEDPTRKLK